MTAASTQPEPVAELVARLRETRQRNTWDGSSSFDATVQNALTEAAAALASMSSRLADAEAKVVERPSLELRLKVMTEKYNETLDRLIAAAAEAKEHKLNASACHLLLMQTQTMLEAATAERDAALALAETSRGKALEEAAKLPKLTDAMILAAAEAHYGKKRVAANGGTGGISMTVNGKDYTFAEAMRRMWPAMSRSLAEASDRAPRDGETEQEERV
jgi:hypothetical protein